MCPFLSVCLCFIDMAISGKISVLCVLKKKTRFIMGQVDKYPKYNAASKRF
jgi:hypothetical protein